MAGVAGSVVGSAVAVAVGSAVAVAALALAWAAARVLAWAAEVRRPRDLLLYQP